MIGVCACSLSNDPVLFYDKAAFGSSATFVKIQGTNKTPAILLQSFNPFYIETSRVNTTSSGRLYSLVIDLRRTERYGIAADLRRLVPLQQY